MRDSFRNRRDSCAASQSVTTPTFVLSLPLAEYVNNT
jgi:hypothetical protein